MFEPTEQPSIKIGICSTEQHFDQSQLDDDAEVFTLSNQLSVDEVNQYNLDLLLIDGSKLKGSSIIDELSQHANYAIARIEHINNDASVITNTIMSFTTKLAVKSMPNNLDVYDIKTLSESSERLLAFDSKQALIEFLRDIPADKIVGCIYLHHGDRLKDGELYLDSYEQISKQVAELLPRQAYGQFTTSILIDGASECSALVGVMRAAK